MILEILEELIPLTGILVGGLIILIPVTAVCMRIFVKPTLESLYRMRQEMAPATEDRRLQDQRVTLLEAEVQALQEQVQALRNVREFDGILKG